MIYNLNELIYLYKLNDNNILTYIIYDNFFDEHIFINILVKLFNYYPNCNMIPFSINIKKNIVIYYQIDKTIKYPYINNLIFNLNTDYIKEVEFLINNDKTLKNLEPIKLLPNFWSYYNDNFKMISKYLKDYKYNVINI